MKTNNKIGSKYNFFIGTEINFSNGRQRGTERSFIR